ncbi:hypothetical protein SADUNF_Sadunf16G0090100 [Salix dunnii]|uniref:Uncharacterized protein n=1 Tax=Salix dunnii TaxID=1413687 RepID=A0A835J7S7_9ROSI|nr:hypothetical protein SADUNF_Sadunf16G0090100 [Salix dunnii]
MVMAMDMDSIYKHPCLAMKPLAIRKDLSLLVSTIGKKKLKQSSNRVRITAHCEEAVMILPHSPILHVISCSIPGELKNLSNEVFKDSGEVDRSNSTKAFNKLSPEKRM